MSSPPLIPILNPDDDDFDWDAAVQEIDAACQSTTTATTTAAASTSSYHTPPRASPHVPFNDNNKLNKPHHNSRQSTLDKFITNPKTSVPVNNCPNLVDDDEIRVPERACYVDVDPLTAQTWIYPDNVPRREYQLAITQTALFSNTLVALPTGLGKTLIAAVVMYNYFRWFPQGKIVFAAPSRPLVMQQIEACHNIVGIPQEWTIDMTGQTSPPKRAILWQSKRVFFVTPQVLEKDIQSGACLVKFLVCLVIDEAHRAMGNYAYCVAVRELMAIPLDLRILALTATPGSKQETIQQVIDNLQISTLEYRSESDVDVCPYVHDRKIELIQVPLGKDATEINDLLWEAIRPLVSRLGAMGVLPNRDYQTLSPCQLIESREKFRQAPPPELSSVKYSDVESYFGVLITLYHIRKLLSSHGIRPAHEMLEEKLRQGYFARLMSRNEDIQKACLLMQKSVSHGAPSPKLSKMLEVLVEHFRNNDPQNSRVIIFSNFRGSVRDILDSLANIGHNVKATQFIGQSSGKNLKGQSQKIQQAVLEKFRMGGYNVIVATSIGEEGLDIMEVDLVICFDANISPLRMIQRMGRTGRKHDGRVVVLACEGTELKGYKRKLATGKTVRKHMQNGGTNSFTFHCSSRMVPHQFKPELQFVKLSIEKFVRQNKNLINDFPRAVKYKEKLSEAEAALLKTYFETPQETCNLSLIAFPHFQAIPSRVHRVKHSVRTGWLIDTMQQIRGNVKRQNCSQSELLDPVSPADSQNDMYNFGSPSPMKAVDDERHMLATCIVPEVVVHLPTNSPSSKQIIPDNFTPNVLNVHPVEQSQYLFNTDEVTGNAMIFHALPCGEKDLVENDGHETADAMETESPALPADRFEIDDTEPDLSPRLSILIKSGFVPESPLGDPVEDIEFSRKGGSDADVQHGIIKKGILALQPTSPPIRCASPLTRTEATLASPQTSEIMPLPVADSMNSPLRMPAESPSEMAANCEPHSAETFRTPLRDLTNGSCSEDWQIHSGERSGTAERPFKLKRLRKIGELAKARQKHCTDAKPMCFAEFAPNDAPPVVVKQDRVKKPFEDVRDFIDEEAEVSSDVVPDSEDDGNCGNSDAYEDSFIDDRADAVGCSSTQAEDSSQAEDSNLDMMAIYRRSLLTQSPFQGPRKQSAEKSPVPVPSTTTITESGECSGRTSSLQTPEGCSNFPRSSARKSVCSRLNNFVPETIPSKSSYPQINQVTTGSRKRKMYSNKPFILPVKNLDKEFSSASKLPSKEVKPSFQANEIDPSWADFADDKFYENIDLDALEAEATKLVSQRTQLPLQGHVSEPPPQDADFLSAPSFDLGIL